MSKIRTIKCSNCQKDFNRYQSHIDQSKSKTRLVKHQFCSRRCYFLNKAEEKQDSKYVVFTQNGKMKSIKTLDAKKFQFKLFGYLITIIIR
jgi:hypothetical protein